MLARRTIPWLVATALLALAAPSASATPGATIWTTTYDGPASLRDTPRDMVVDPVTNRVYVVGTATVSTGFAGDITDIVTIAYDGNTGAKLWARRYDGAAHGSDLGIAIAFDRFSGGVMVLGASETIVGGGQPRAVTIAYNTDGSRRWVRRVKNPRTDLPTALVVVNGSTYVLVHSTQYGRLIAYDTTGARTWAVDATSYDQSGFVDLEAIGSYLIVVGTLDDGSGGTAIFTVGWAVGGIALWSKHFAGPDAHAVASEAAVGADGTMVYVTGSYLDGTETKITTIAYDPHDGYRFWRRSIPPQASTEIDLLPHVAVSDDGGSIAVSTGSELNSVYTLLTRQYSSGGSVDWTARENGAGESGQSADVAIGPGGKVFVTGLGTNSGATPGAFTLAYPSSGPPSLFQAPLPNTDREDGGFVVAPGPFGDRVFVASRVNLDIRVDAYSTY
jgi:hypothetical protein